MKFVKLNGLNKRTIAVEPLQVMFLEEHELDGNLITNVHFANGKWVTAAHPLDEVYAIVGRDRFEKTEEEEEKEDQAKLERWRKQAKARREIQIEIDEALRNVGKNLKHKSYQREEFADGSGKIVIHYEPKDSVIE